LHGWEFPDEKEESQVLVIKVDATCWQMGIRTDETPTFVEKFPLDLPSQTTRLADENVCSEWCSTAAKLIAQFVETQCEGILPCHALFVMSPATFERVGGNRAWANIALTRVGFLGFLTVDSRHMCMYASSRQVVSLMLVDLLDNSIQS
jgi:hypothetical protein